MIQPLPILGFSPDLSPDTPGILTDSDQILPTERGICNGLGYNDAFTSQPAGGGQTVTITTLPAVNGASNYMGTQRWFVGTTFGFSTGTVYEQAGTGGGLTDVTGSLNGVAANNYYSFTQFGSVSLGVSLASALSKSATPGTAFTAVSGAPKANIAVTCGLPNALFVMLFDYDAGSGRVQDGVFWSGISDYTAWTPSISTQCGNLQIYDVGGGFTNAIPYRDGVIAWKAHSMHVGSYVGGAGVWSWTTLSKDVGCLGKGAAVVADDILYFADNSGIWMYDGSFPQRVPGNIHRWWRQRFAATFPGSFARLAWLKSRGVLLSSYVDISVSKRIWLAYHPRSQVWTLHGAIRNSDSGTTLWDLSADGVVGSTSDIPPRLCLINQLDGPQSLNANDAYYTMHALGDEFSMTTLRGLRPRIVYGPADTAPWLSGTVYHDASLRNVTAQSVAMSPGTPGVLDVMISDRRLLPKVSLARTAGPWEIVANSLDVFSDGQE